MAAALGVPPETSVSVWFQYCLQAPFPPLWVLKVRRSAQVEGRVLASGLACPEGTVRHGKSQPGLEEHCFSLKGLREQNMIFSCASEEVERWTLGKHRDFSQGLFEASSPGRPGGLS